MFGDAELNALEEQVEVSNQTVVQAEARYRQARALVVSARTAYDKSVAAYRQMVLTGFQEGEDNLAAQRILDREAQVPDFAVQAAQQSLAVTMNQYQAGIVSYLNVVLAQAIALANQRSAVEILRQRLSASVPLVNALGGGWKTA